MVPSPQKGYSSQQKELFAIDPLHVMEARILEDGRLRADKLLYAARAKLDNVGYIKAHSCIVNDESRLERMRERLQLYEMEGEIQLAQKKEKELKAAREAEELRPVLKEAITLYISGDHGRRMQIKFIKAILLFAFETTPRKSNVKKDDMLEQLKKLDQNDTENKIQRALETTIADVSGGAVASSDEADDHDEQSSTNTTGGESPGCESNGEVDDDGEKDSDESIGNDSENNNETESSACVDHIDTVVHDDGERDSDESIGNDSENNNEMVSSMSGDSIDTVVHEVQEKTVLDGGDTMHGCEATFDGKRKCVIAICNNCRDASGGERRRGAGGCKCRRLVTSKSVKDLSERIVADWNLGIADPTNPEWEDLLFALPVDCAVCHRFISAKVKELVKEAVEQDAVRKRREDPTWVARDWFTLRRVVQGTWT